MNWEIFFVSRRVSRKKAPYGFLHQWTHGPVLYNAVYISDLSFQLTYGQKRKEKKSEYGREFDRTCVYVMFSKALGDQVKICVTREGWWLWMWKQREKEIPQMIINSLTISWETARFTFGSGRFLYFFFAFSFFSFFLPVFFSFF